jgi:4'-phosphopantetheinyl transferase
VHDLEPEIDAALDFRTLDHRTIHVWRMRLDATPATVAAIEQILSPDEVIRATRFRFDHLQRRYVLARGALRILLAQYLQVAARRIEFDYGEKGKPRVAAGGIHFNLSRSGSNILLAFSRQYEVGIDIEEFRPVPDLQGMADRFFCAEEAAELRSLPDDERERSFLVCWTRKEAYIKALGVGLSAPLDSFRITLRRGEPVRFIHFAGGANQDHKWMLHDLGMHLCYAAALAYRAVPQNVKVGPLIDSEQLMTAFDPAVQGI